MKKPLVALFGALSLAACCLARGTLVSTPRGPRRIEDLIEQDTLWSVDPATGERFASHLIAIARASREVMVIAGADFSLTCTTDHPLYDPSTKSWAPAGDWVLGHRSELLLVTEDGVSRVVSVQHREVSVGVREVFDLSVDHQLHNFVAAGVLVHNKKNPNRYQNCLVEQPEGQLTLRHGVDTCTQQDGGQGQVECDADAGVNGVCLPLDE